MKQENLHKKIKSLELRLQQKTRQLRKSKLESEHLTVALDEAYTKLKELYPYVKLLQEETKDRAILH
ncbi:MAG: hypothetical protein ABH868_05845 [bacterium]